MIQSIIFDNTKWTPAKAKRWLKKHEHTPIKKAHNTENFIRYRMAEPMKDAKYITKKLGNGIELVIQI